MQPPGSSTSFSLSTNMPAEHDVLVLGRIHVVAELVGGEPELGVEAEIGGATVG